MKITRLTTGSDNRSHIETFDFPEITREDLAEGRMHGNVAFSTTEEGNEQPLHAARRRVYVVQLSGVVELETGAGELQRVGPGEVFLAEDLAGEGHRSRVIEGPSVQMLIEPGHP